MCYRDTRLACRGAPTHVYHITCTRQTSTSWELLRPCHRLPFCSPFPSRLLFVAGGPTWPEGKACTHHSNRMATCSPPTWSAKIGTSKQASAEHRETVSMHARHAHIAMHSAKQQRMPGMRYKASSALGTGRLCYAKCSRRPGSAHTSKGERMAASVTSLPQFVVR